MFGIFFVLIFHGFRNWFLIRYELHLELKKKWFESNENLFRYPETPHLFERNNFIFFQLSFELKQTKIISFKQMRRCGWRNKFSFDSKTIFFPCNPHSTECCKKMSGIFTIFYCSWNIVATFLSNIAKYFIATLQFQLSEIFLKTNKYLILSEIL